MNLEEAKKRVEVLMKDIELSIANHNMLVGRLNEAKHLVEMMEKCNIRDAEIIEHEAKEND